MCLACDKSQPGRDKSRPAKVFHLSLKNKRQQQQQQIKTFCKHISWLVFISYDFQKLEEDSKRFSNGQLF